MALVLPKGPSSATKEKTTVYEIVPNFYLSKYPDVVPGNVKHVLNVGSEPSNDASYLAMYLHIPFAINENFALKHIPISASFISSNLSSNQGVVVYCSDGTNFSAAIVLAHLVATNKTWNAEDALVFLKTRKSDVNPNPAFMKRINEYFGRNEKENSDVDALVKGTEASNDSTSLNLNGASTVDENVLKTMYVDEASDENIADEWSFI